MKDPTPRARRPWSPVRRFLARLAALALALLPSIARAGHVRLPPLRPEDQTVDLADEILYQFMPIAWRDSDNDELRFGDFGGMTASLDYLKDLGVTGVWMTPIFPSPAYHGYQHLEADKLNPRFGTTEQFLAFVRAAHEKNLKVFLDFVVYGINQESTYFTDSYKNPQSKYSSWLAYKDDQNTTYLGYTFTSWNGYKVGFVHWNLNTLEPRRLVTDWAKRWLDPDGDGDPSDGVDGFRLDHVWARYKEGPDGWGYNLEEFWIPWKRALRDVNPKVITFAEQAQWETTGEELLPAFDAAFTKPWEVAARRSLREGKAEHVYKAMHEALRAAQRAQRNERGGKGTFLAILGDHDVDRLAGDIESKGAEPDEAMRRPALAAFMLMTQPFPPVVYMGDEIGMLGVRQKGPTDASDIPVREPFKWNAVAGPPMTDYWRPNKLAIEHAFSHDNDGRSVQEQAGKPGSLLETYRALIALRRSSQTLRRGEYIALHTDDPSLWVFLRSKGDEMLMVAVNLSSSEISTILQPPRMVGRWGAWNFAEVFRLPQGGEDRPSFNQGTPGGTLRLPALGAAVFRFERPEKKP